MGPQDRKHVRLIVTGCVQANYFRDFATTILEVSGASTIHPSNASSIKSAVERAMRAVFMDYNLFQYTRTRK